MTSDLSSALQVLDDDVLYKSTYTLLYFTPTNWSKIAQFSPLVSGVPVRGKAVGDKQLPLVTKNLNDGAIR